MKKLNFKKSLVLLSLLSFACLSSISAYDLTACDSVATCYDSLTDKDVNFKLNYSQNYMIEYPWGISTTHLIWNWAGAEVPFIVSYNSVTGNLDFSINGVNVQTMAIPEQVFETLTITSIIPIGKSVVVSLTGMTLNGEVLSDISTTSATNGLIFSNFVSEEEGFILSGNIEVTDGAGTIPTLPFFNVILSGMVDIASLSEVIVIAGQTIEYEKTFLDNETTENLGGLNIQLLETEIRTLNFGDILIWENIIIDYIENFEVLVFETNGDLDLENLVYGEVFETSELIQFGMMTTPNAFETLNVVDNTNAKNGFSVLSSEFETLALIPVVDFSVGCDVWVIYE